jgi:hypothetical protein
MKKRLIVVLACTLLLFGACKKNGEEAPVTPDNTWTLDGTLNVVSSTTRSEATANTEASIVFKDDANGGKAKLRLDFVALPTATGTYQITAFDGEKLSGKECRLYVYDKAGGGWYFTGAPVSVEIGFTKDNKIKVTIPEVRVTVASPAPILTLNASVYEQ